MFRCTSLFICFCCNEIESGQFSIYLYFVIINNINIAICVQLVWLRVKNMYRLKMILGLLFCSVGCFYANPEKNMSNGVKKSHSTIMKQPIRKQETLKQRVAAINSCLKAPKIGDNRYINNNLLSDKFSPNKLSNEFIYCDKNNSLLAALEYKDSLEKITGNELLLPSIQVAFALNSVKQKDTTSLQKSKVEPSQVERDILEGFVDSFCSVLY